MARKSINKVARVGKAMRMVAGRPRTNGDDGGAWARWWDEASDWGRRSAGRWDKTRNKPLLLEGEKLSWAKVSGAKAGNCVGARTNGTVEAKTDDARLGETKPSQWRVRLGHMGRKRVRMDRGRS